MYGAGAWYPSAELQTTVRRSEATMLRAALRVRKPESVEWAKFFSDAASLQRQILATHGLKEAVVRRLQAHHRWAGHIARLAAQPGRSPIGEILSYRDPLWWEIVQSGLADLPAESRQ